MALVCGISAGLFVCACSGKPAPGSSLADYIGVEAAKEAALAASGVPAGQACVSSAQLTDRDGIACYLVEFAGEEAEHSYEIDAMTGIVLAERHTLKSSLPAETPGQAMESSAEGAGEKGGTDEIPANAQGISDSAASDENGKTPDAADASNTAGASGSKSQAAGVHGSDSHGGGQGHSSSETPPVSAAGSSAAANPPAGSSQGVDADAALSIALSHAGLKSQDISYNNVKRDTEDGQPVFEVEFVLPDGSEYEYEVRISDGAVLSFDHEAKAAPHHGSSGHGAVISESQARQAVLGKVPQARESDIFLELEEDDGRWEYEGWVVCGGAKYEFTIDACSGGILEWERD